ncbi:MAG: glycosyltransferase family 9 protein [Pseudohongiellaceae bacterium]
MSLGLVQEFVGKIESKHQDYFLLFDEEFKATAESLFDTEKLLFYPRHELKNTSGLQRARIYLRFITKLRKLGADTAIDLEGDSVSSMLTMLSGAQTKVGPFGCPRSQRYTHISKPKRSAQQSEFYRYRNVLATVIELEESAPRYGQLKLPLLDNRFNSKLVENGLTQRTNLVVCHTGASKVRKLWPREHWIELIKLLQGVGVTPVLVGTGTIEADNNIAITCALQQPIVNLTNKLSLLELALLTSRSQFFIGNDSGPMHLACSLGIEGIGIFGPTYECLWGPLLPNVVALRSEACPLTCNNGHACDSNISCLAKLTPKMVFQEFRNRYPRFTEPKHQRVPAPPILATELQPTPVDGQRDSVHSSDRLAPHSAAL